MKWRGVVLISGMALTVGMGCGRRAGSARLPNMVIPVACASEITLMRCDARSVRRSVVGHGFGIGMGVSGLWLGLPYNLNHRVAQRVTGLYRWLAAWWVTGEMLVTFFTRVIFRKRRAL